MSIAVELLDDDVRAEVSEGWRCTSLSDVDWALGRISELQREQAENESIVEERIALLRMRLDSLNKRTEGRAAWFESRIRDYAESNRAEFLKGKQKSRTLPSGRIGWRTVPAKLEVRESAEVILWALECGVPEVLRTKTEIDKAALIARFEATGEIPPGCESVDERQELQIKPGGA